MPVRRSYPSAIERIAKRGRREDRGHETPCLIYTGALQSAGYGTVRHQSRTQLVHRVVWEHHHGPIPEGLELDHLCRQRDCHEATHLEAVTRRENQIRGNGVAGTNARKTHCPAGHEYTSESTYRFGSSRQCRICKKSRDAGRKR